MTRKTTTQDGRRNNGGARAGAGAKSTFALRARVAELEAVIASMEAEAVHAIALTYTEGYFANLAQTEANTARLEAALAKVRALAASAGEFGAVLSIDIIAACDAATEPKP